jgi:dipeptidyl aminopeptidase/acylaminoacyl peptidase
MKLYHSILVFILCTTLGFSQNSNRLTGVTSNSLVGDRLFLEHYLWGYSKSNSGKGEKAVLDFNAIDNWRELGYYLAVSDDGKYFAYTINKPTGTRYWFRRLDSLVVQSTRTGWRLAFAGSNPGFFTANGEKYVFNNGETLCFLQLGKSQPRKIKEVVSYKVLRQGRNEWLAWQLKGNDSNFFLYNLVTGKEIPFSGITDYSFDKSGEWLACKRANDLLLYNLVTGKERHFPFVVEYAFASNGKALLLKTIEKNNSGVTTALKYLGAPGWEEKIIWSGNKEKTDISSYSVDISGRHIVFSQDSVDTRIWYYNADTDIAMVKATNTTPGISEELTIKGDVSFSDNDRYIRFSLQPLPDTRKPDPEIAQVEIWDHKDLYLQNEQAELSKQPKIYTAFINIENGKVSPLENNGKNVYLLQGDFAVVKKYPEEEHGERFWEVRNRNIKDSNWLVSLKDGSSQFLPTRSGIENFWFSPNGKYLVYFDLDKGCHYFSYDLHTGELKDITVNIPENQLGYLNHYSNSNNKALFGNIAAWLEDDAGVLVYDDYDIWKLDLAGKEPGINMTSGFGHSNKTMLILSTTDHYSSDIPVIKANAPLFLRAFNTWNKQSGFYRKADLKAGAPKLLYLGSYFTNKIFGWQDPNLSNDGLAPVKAKDRDTWIVQRQSSTDAPNYYETNDFKSFKRLTNFQPQQHFKWLSEELHSFKHLDGREGQGILYKPDDFDSTKKYPVLIAFYGAFSNNLNQLHAPSYIDHAMAPGKSPIWFVNNGYLVFTPDVYTTPLKYGPSAFNVIEGAAQYLKQLPYVDASKLGCASHSWAANLGAYLFTHSTSFSATAISEGIIYTNPINMAFSQFYEGHSRLKTVEIEMEYGNLYENKEAWLDQTTILQADKAKSPLLLFCNKESSPGMQEQTLQLFTALRRLEKNVWWLKYDNGAHTLQDLKELRDYTIRYTQFFDHYLKEAPAPQWMTQGLPLAIKGIESRYELDPKGSCGKDCKVCKKWNEQYKKYPEMFAKPIREWHLE